MPKLTMTISDDSADARAALKSVEGAVRSIQSAAQAASTVTQNIIPEKQLITGETQVLNTRRAMALLAGMLGMAGPQAQVMALGLRAATVASGTLTGSMTALSAAVKGFLTGIGPVGWAIIAVTAAISGLIYMWSKHKKALEDQKKAAEDYAAGLAGIKDIAKQTEIELMKLRGDRLQAELAEITESTNNAKKGLQDKYLAAREAAIKEGRDTRQLEIKRNAEIVEINATRDAKEKAAREQFAREELDIIRKRAADTLDLENQAALSSLDGHEKQLKQSELQEKEARDKLRALLKAKEIDRIEYEKRLNAIVDIYGNERVRIQQEIDEEQVKPSAERLESIKDIIDKLKEEETTLGMTNAQLIEYELRTKGATEAEIAWAKAHRQVIDDTKKMSDAIKTYTDAMADLNYQNALKMAELQGDAAKAREIEIQHLMDANKWTEEEATAVYENRKRQEELNKALEEQNKIRRASFVGLVEAWESLQASAAGPAAAVSAQAARSAAGRGGIIPSTGGGAGMTGVEKRLDTVITLMVDVKRNLPLIGAMG